MARSSELHAPRKIALLVTHCTRPVNAGPATDLRVVQSFEERMAGRDAEAQAGTTLSTAAI